MSGESLKKFKNYPCCRLHLARMVPEVEDGGATAGNLMKGERCK